MSGRTQPVAKTEPPAAVPLAGVAISLAFWLVLLTSAGLFGLVSLSPKVAAYWALQEQHQTQQAELVDLEAQHRELERVIGALQTDPNFAAELARLEFDAVRPGEEILSVDSALRLEPHAAAKPHRSPAVYRSAWRPWVQTLAYYQPVRIALLAAAAILVLWAFGWLQDRAESA